MTDESHKRSAADVLQDDLKKFGAALIRRVENGPLSAEFVRILRVDDRPADSPGSGGGFGAVRYVEDEIAVLVGEHPEPLRTFLLNYTEMLDRTLRALRALVSPERPDDWCRWGQSQRGENEDPVANLAAAYEAMSKLYQCVMEALEPRALKEALSALQGRDNERRTSGTSKTPTDEVLRAILAEREGAKMTSRELKDHLTQGVAVDFAEPAWERIRFVQLDATDHLHWYTKERGDEVTLPRDAPGWAWVLTRAKELELVEKRGGRREEAPAVAKIRNGAS